MESAAENRATPEDDIVRLVRLAQAHEEEAFTALWKRFRRPLMAFISRKWEGALSAEDVEDLSQVIFANAFRSIGGFRFTCQFSTWLFTIAINECNRWMDRRRKMFALVSGPVDEEECSKVASHEQRTICTVRAEKVYAQMNPQSQRVIKRVFQNGETTSEIAEGEGITQDRVRYIVRVFLEKLSAEDTGKKPS